MTYLAADDSLLSLPSRVGKLIRFSHTVFALPFALASSIAAANGFPTANTFLWILLCMVFARTAAMLFNRLADWEIDQLNPRTQERSKLIPKTTAQILFFLSLILFVFSTTQLNLLCVALSPLAIAIICFYSLTKRFTKWCHLYLGLALAVAPLGAWAAVQGSLLHPAPFLLAATVLLWVAGFDIIYSTLDADFDRSVGLHSLPSRWGIASSLRLAILLHLSAFCGMVLFGFVLRLGAPYWVFLALIAPLLFWEHRLARSSNASLINRAFFQTNAAVSFLFLLGVSSSQVLR